MNVSQPDFKMFGFATRCFTAIWLRRNFSDKISGVKSKRPGLDQVLQYARKEDMVVVWRLDRLGRNMQDIIQLVNTMNERGIGFHSLQENLTMDRGSATGRLMFHLFAAFAEFEHNLIKERSAAGRAAAQ